MSRVWNGPIRRTILQSRHELRILQLQRDRQQVAVERQKRNAEKLLVKSPIRGMVALSNVWRNNSLGHAEEGDQLWPGSPLLKVFDPTGMDVEVSVGEPDGAVLVPGAKAIVHLDAFPTRDLPRTTVRRVRWRRLRWELSVKSFTARFRIGSERPAPAAGSFGGCGHRGFQVKDLDREVRP